jgi:hypothetical protein
MNLLDIAPSYPLDEQENWRVLQMESESGIEQRVSKWEYPKRGWDLRWVGANYTETTSVREFVRRVYGPASGFLWKEPYLTTRWRVKLGYGDGSRTDWLIPVTGATSLTFHVNSTIVVPSINSTGGQNGLGIATFSAPADGAPVDFDYVDGYYHPIVRVNEPFRYQAQAPLNYGQITFSIIETKEDYPES